MDDVYVLTEPEQLKALSDPLRLSVLSATMRDPITIAQVAERLGENPRKLYYHFTELERLGLIRVVETRQKGNLIEKLYQAVAKFISVDWTLFSHSAEGREQLAENITAMLHNSALAFRKNLQEERLSPEQVERVWPLQTVFSLPSDDVDEFRDRLRSLLEEFRGRSGGQRHPRAALTLLFYPFTPAQEETTSPMPEEGETSHE